MERLTSQQQGTLEVAFEKKPALTKTEKQRKWCNLGENRAEKGIMPNKP